DLPGLFVPDDPGQERGSVAGVEATHLGSGLAKDRVVGGNGEVADDLEHVAPADAVSGHHGDDRLRERPAQPLEAADVEPGGLVVAYVAPAPAPLLVAP